jgi:hypothetical protein
MALAQRSDPPSFDIAADYGKLLAEFNRKRQPDIYLSNDADLCVARFSIC